MAGSRTQITQSEINICLFCKLEDCDQEDPRCPFLHQKNLTQRRYYWKNRQEILDKRKTERRQSDLSSKY